MYQVNNKRIAKNTLLLYVRMFITLSISLYTSRIVFQALGITDLGIYNVVGGIVGMLGFLNTGLSGASQRFLSYELESGDTNLLIKIFRTILTLHCFLALILLILAETIGLWFINTYLIIPADRHFVANYVYQTAIFMSITSIIGVPFTACIMSHEKMGIYAYFSILDVIFKLAIAFALLYIGKDKLTLYVQFSALSTFISLFINIIYSCRKFQECSLLFSWDKIILKKVFGLSGWNSVWQLTFIANGQIVNIFFNLFLGPVVNGAKNIADQTNGIIYNFVSNFQSAVRPPITKCYAVNKIEEVKKLVFRSSKFSFYLILILSSPILISTDYILYSWLGKVPDYTVGFCRLILINTLFDSMTGPIVTVLNATGHIKQCTILTTIVLFLIIPISYVILSIGFAPYWTLTVNIAATFISLCIRAYYVEKLTGITLKEYFKEVMFISYLIAILTLSIPTIFLNYLIIDSLFNFIYISLICLSSSITFIYFLGLQQDEKRFFKSKLSVFMNK